MQNQKLYIQREDAYSLSKEPVDKSLLSPFFLKLINLTQTANLHWILDNKSTLREQHFFDESKQVDNDFLSQEFWNFESRWRAVPKATKRAMSIVFLVNGNELGKMENLWDRSNYKHLHFPVIIIVNL